MFPNRALEPIVALLGHSGLAHWDQVDSRLWTIDLKGGDMIKNFEEVRNQLKELADVVNSFKSEAVQLRIVDLVFNLPKQSDEDNNNTQIQGAVKHPSKRTKVRSKTKTSVSNDEGQKKKPMASGHGPTSTLTKLTEGDFFNKPQSMKSIIEHCEINLARKIKQNDISGKLARMVRDGILKRAKNSDGQYEYNKA
jgi:hypothetical protein